MLISYKHYLKAKLKQNSTYLTTLVLNDEFLGYAFKGSDLSQYQFQEGNSMSSQQTTKPLKTALIGLGMVADTHVQAITGLDGKVQLKGIFARGQQAARDYAITAESICGSPV